MNTRIRRLGVLLALLAALALLSAFALAEGTDCTVYLNSGMGDTVTIPAAVGDEFTIPECPASFQPPSVYRHFGGWREAMSGSDYYMPGDTVTLTGSLSLTARWYYSSSYDLQGTLTNGMTWRLQIDVGDGSGAAIPDDAGGQGENRKYIAGASLTVTGEGAMPNFTEPFAAPWDSVLHTLWSGGHGLARRNITHTSVSGSWQEAVPLVITLDDRITSIGSYCFTGGNFFYETIHLPASLTRIENYAFYDSYYLFDVQLPQGLTYIGDYAFYNCKEIVATTDETLSWYYFRYDHPLPYDGVLTIPDSVSYIGSYAFAKAGMYRVLLPHGLTEIRAGTFCQARDLNFAFLPDTLVSIGDRAFQGCGTEYEWVGANGYGQADMCTGYQLTVLPYSEVSDPRTLTACMTIHFPATLRTLGQYAFYNCSDVYSVIIPEGVTEIPAYCFSFCRDLSSVTLPESLTTIGPYAFNKNYYLGASVRNITDITIPRGVTSIGDYALGFRDTSQRQTMTVRGYRGTEAERYTLWGQNLDMSSSILSQGTWTFVPLDTEVLSLFGSIDGADYACGADAESMGGYLFEPGGTENVYTLTATFPGDSYVGLKRDKDDKDGPGLLYYSAAENPGASASAVLTDRGETTDTDHLLFVPGRRKVIFTLTRNSDGSFTLSYELPADYGVVGDFTGWDYEPFVYNGTTGMYEYAVTLDPDAFYRGFADFYLVLNDDDYGASDSEYEIFDSVNGLPLCAMMDESGNYADSVCNLNLYPSEAADFTLIFDDSACALTVESNVTQHAAYLAFPQRGGEKIRMGDPADPPSMSGEEGGGMDYGTPDEPYAFSGETTVWACSVLYDGEYDNPCAFQIIMNGARYGNDSVIFQEALGGTDKTVRIMGSDWAQLQAGQSTDVMVAQDHAGIYDFYFGLDTHRVMVVRRSTDYAVQYDLSKPYDGSSVSFYLETFTVPEITDAEVAWYRLVDGEEVYYEDAYWWYEYGEELTYTHFYGPYEVGDYVLELRNYYGGLLIRHYFSITESGMQGGLHTYELAGALDKAYDGEPVAFDPCEDLLIDGGKTDWSTLQDNGEARYLWRVLSGKEMVDAQDTPTAVGAYQLVIQEYAMGIGKKGEDGKVEGGKTEAEWIDAAVFPFEITGPACAHAYGAPVWTWQGTESASAAFTCAECGYVTSVDADLTYRVQNGLLICTATAVFEDQTCTDSAFVEGSILILPSGLTTVGSEAFINTAADAVVVPRSVTSIADDAFPAGTDVYAFADTEGAAYAARATQRLFELTD